MSMRPFRRMSFAFISVSWSIAKGMSLKRSAATLGVIALRMPDSLNWPPANTVGVSEPGCCTATVT